MRILDAFRDWLSDSEEKEKFAKHWIQKHVSAFSGQSEEADKYHAEQAYEVAKLQALFDLHEQKLKDMEDRINSLPGA